MQKQPKIEHFFDTQNFNWKDFVESLPVGVLFFDENWKIKSINKKFVKLFQDETIIEKLIGANLFSKNYLSDKLPLRELLQLKENKNFEKVVFLRDRNANPLNLLFKGSPIFSDGIFKGGTIVAEEYIDESYKTSSPQYTPNSITNIIEKISKHFFIVDPEGIVETISDDISNKHKEIYGNEGRKIDEIFTADSELSVKSILNDTINKRSVNYCTLTYFSDREQVTFKAVFIPFENINDEINKVIILLREINSSDEDSITHLSNSFKLKEYESIATANSDGILKINLHGIITFWDDNASKLFGVSERSITSKFIGKIFPEITQDYFEEIRKKILKNGVWEGYLVNDYLSENNLFRVKIISKANNQKTDLFVYCNKIDKHQQQIIATREEEKLFFRDAVVKSDQMILQASPNGTILFSNDKFCKIFEYELDELRGKLFTDLIDLKFKSKNNITDIETLLNRKDFEILPLISKLGQNIEVCYSINISTVNSELNYFTIFIKECSSKDQLFLKTSHALLYQFNDPVVIIQDEQIIKVNPKFCELFGSEFEADYFNLNINKIVDSETLTEFNQILKSSTVFEDKNYIKFRKVDGNNFYANVKKICCSKESSFSVLVLKAEDSESSSDSNTNFIKNRFENLGPYYWSGRYENNELKIDYLDSDFIKSVGYNYTDSLSQSDFLNEITHPNDAEKVNYELNKIVNDKEINEKTIISRVVNKNGEIIWISNKVKCEILIEDNSAVLFGSITDVTERLSEKEELKSIIDELDKLNTAKEKFISIISHDLKSPFTSIVGFAELILTDSTLDKDEIIEFVGHIKEASFHTVDLLNGLLDLTKLQTGRIEVEPKILNANYIANKTVEILSGLAFQKGLSLSANIDKSFYVTADENLIFQVFNNLVANSIKFTPKGGNIEILAREIPEKLRVEFTVKDSGIGIEKEDLDKLFVLDKKFTTLGTDGERGTGLGLSLVHEIIEKHSGEISVKSEIGKGSQFIFTLPISSPSILIIDGVQSERILYTRLLESITSSIEIIQARNEDEGLALIKEKMPMLIIFEHHLPNMAGDDFIGEIKKAGLHYEPSLMILTKDFNESLEKSYKNIGVNNVFSKPFELKKFKESLDKLIGNS